MTIQTISKCLLRLNRRSQFQSGTISFSPVTFSFRKAISSVNLVVVFGIKPGSAIANFYGRVLEMCISAMKKMYDNGIYVCVGGGYKFA